PILLNVGGVLPLHLLLNGLKDQFGVVGEAPDRPTQTGEPCGICPVAQDGSRHVCAVAFIEIGSSIVATGIGNILVIVGGNRIVFEKSYAAGKASIAVVRTPGVQSRIPDGPDLPLAARIQAFFVDRRHAPGRTHDTCRYVITDSRKRSLADAAYSMNARK